MMCEEKNLPTGKKTQLIKILEFSDIIDGLESLEYKNMTSKALQELCKGRELPSAPGSVSALRKILELNEMVIKLNNHEEQNGSDINEIVREIDTESNTVAHR